MPPYHPIFVVVLAAVTATVAPAAAHTAGACAASTAASRCEQWSVQWNDATIAPPNRSDQFPTSVAANATTAFVTLKNVALNPADPYAASGSWVVLARDLATGAPRWTADRRTRHYDVPLGSAVSPDGTRLYVTGAAYDAYSIAADDSRVVTVAYDAATGAELWSATWDGRPDATDNGKLVAVSADGHEVYMGGVTTSADGSLDYVVAGYAAATGRELWATTYAGPRAAGTDALFGLAVDPRGEFVYATGYSESAVQYDNDYTTVAVRTSRGRRGGIAWVARWDGVGANRSDRASSVSVSPDGSQVVVTGDSYGGEAAGRTLYDAATIAYSRSGALLWEARWAGAAAGLHVGRAVAAGHDGAVVVVQAPGATAEDGLDIVTLSYDTAGRQRWVTRLAEARRSELANDVALSPDGTLAYAVGTSAPVVHSSIRLKEQALMAYRVTDGSLAWQSRLDPGAGNALSGDDVAVTPGGGQVVTAGQATLSQSPLEGQSANAYDTVVTAFAAR